MQQMVELQPQMHRIDLDLGFAPSKMDNVAQVEKIYKTVKCDSTGGQRRDQILETTCNLGAHMFFSQKAKDASRPPGSRPAALSGVIACRIRNENPKLSNLGNFMKKYSCALHAAVFRIRTFQEATDTARGKSTDLGMRIQFTTSMGGNQNMRWKFQCPEQTIMVENDSALIHIDLNLEIARWKEK